MRFPRVLASFSAALMLGAGLTAGPSPAAVAAPSIGALAGAGERAGATRLPFTAGDSVRAQVDVGSGNLLVTVRGFALPDVNRQVQLGAFYNSAASQVTPTPRLGRGWGLDYTPQDVRVVENADDSVTYHASGGLTGVFTPVVGSSTRYVSPGGFKETLTKTAAGWSLTEHQSQDTLRFDTGGGLVSITDRNGNTTTITASGSNEFRDVAIDTPAGTTRAGTATVSTEANGNTTLSHGGSDTLRQVRFARNGADASSFTDARGRNTSFGYNSTGLLTQISAPGSVTTRIGYDAQRRVTSITQVNNGGPGESVTRLAYPTATQTLLASPDTDQSQPVTSVPRTTYTLNSAQRVTRAVDAAGREQAATYTANFDAATATAGTGTGASTTTNTYGANAGQSLTQTRSGQGSSRSLSYANASGPAQYLPTGGTDDAANTSTYTYNGAGNQLTSTNAAAAQNRVSYNTDGTAASATAPGNATRYAYSGKQVTSITPVTGSSLGARPTPTTTSVGSGPRPTAAASPPPTAMTSTTRSPRSATPTARWSPTATTRPGATTAARRTPAP